MKKTEMKISFKVSYNFSALPPKNVQCQNRLRSDFKNTEKLRTNLDKNYRTLVDIQVWIRRMSVFKSTSNRRLLRGLTHLDKNYQALVDSQVWMNQTSVFKSTSNQRLLTVPTKVDTNFQTLVNIRVWMNQTPAFLWTTNRLTLTVPTKVDTNYQTLVDSQVSKHQTWVLRSTTRLLIRRFQVHGRKCWTWANRNCQALVETRASVGIRVNKSCPVLVKMWALKHRTQADSITSQHRQQVG